MKTEVIVPARRQTIDRLLYSLSRQSQLPDLVTIVTNEVRPAATFGLRVQLLGFSSDCYAVGHRDVALRRNAAIWESDADYLIFQDDDQLASPEMIERSCELLNDKLFAWGHHRFIDFDRWTWDQILAKEPSEGRSRERGVNRLHGWYSCYAGMLAVRRDFAIDLRGFDMQFMGDHAGEDQHFGRRMIHFIGQAGAWIYEPPFAWHPEAKDPYVEPHSNTCPGGIHAWTQVFINGVEFRRCRACPEQVYVGGRNDRIDDVLIPYEHDRVVVTKEML